ncbi:hypothetical protein [Nannocystis sp.]|uniref:hypothetical protein n=1 Tax=Nannocystis sp. TaxID=1962667 RepID=UPI0025F3FA5E|nr:hypothetical protein [Nannocystis sp.]MBK7830559.1 hypothetical protein [Nannocystis sp.]
MSFVDLTINSALPTAVPGIYYAASKAVGPYLKLVLNAIQASSPATFYAEISLVLHMRELA